MIIKGAPIITNQTKKEDKMNKQKIEERFDKLPEVLQLVLIAGFYPVLCTLGISILVGWFILIEFLVRG
tara:strand:+ start:210 stop:416 length:207 start_codon:yes stop_codon:yes gene_type:complete